MCGSTTWATAGIECKRVKCFVARGARIILIIRGLVAICTIKIGVLVDNSPCRCIVAVKSAPGVSSWDPAVEAPMDKLLVAFFDHCY